METQNRLKSPVFWTAIAAQILSILVYMGVIGPEMSEMAQGLVVMICELLTVLGILNNPTNKKGI